MLGLDRGRGYQDHQGNGSLKQMSIGKLELIDERLTMLIGIDE